MYFTIDQVKSAIDKYVDSRYIPTCGVSDPDFDKQLKHHYKSGAMLSMIWQLINKLPEDEQQDWLKSLASKPAEPFHTPLTPTDVSLS